MDFTGNYIVFRLYEKLEWEMGRKGEEESCNDKFPSWENLSHDSGGRGVFQLRKKIKVKRQVNVRFEKMTINKRL
jgi:hypothetical protein